MSNTVAALRVSVVVITKNQRAFLAQSLPALAAQIGLAPPQIIVVDSGSTDGAQEIARRYGRLVCLAPDDFSYARAHNAGAREATGAILVRLSGDAIPARTDWLYHLLRPFADSRVAATWGRQISPAGVRNHIEQGFEAWLRPATVSRRYTRPVTPLGCAMAVRRTLWEACPYDERLPQAEDYAFLRFWLRRGYAGVFVPESPVIHGHNESIGVALRRSVAQSAIQGLIRAGWYDTPAKELPVLER